MTPPSPSGGASGRLSPRQAAGVAEELRTAVLRTSRRLRYEASPGAVSPGQHAVLVALLGGPRTPRQLAERERVKPPSMTRTVAGLEQLGLVTRANDPKDRRQVLLSLTEAGRASIEATRRRRTEWLARRLAGMDAEDGRILARAAELLQELAATP